MCTLFGPRFGFNSDQSLFQSGSTDYVFDLFLFFCLYSFLPTVSVCTFQKGV